MYIIYIHFASLNKQIIYLIDIPVTYKYFIIILNI